MVFATAFSFACGSSESGNTETETVSSSVHQLPTEAEQKVTADAEADLRVIASVGKDPSPLSQAMTGTALSDTTVSINSDLAQGKYKKRDYQNIHVIFQDYTSPVASVFAEFDDNGYFIDASTGAALGPQASEHKQYALALVEEENRWKIKMILSPSAASSGSSQ